MARKFFVFEDGIIKLIGENGDEIDISTETTLLAVKNNLLDLVSRIGEVSNTPSDNTVLDRLKDINDKLQAIVDTGGFFPSEMEVKNDVGSPLSVSSPKLDSLDFKIGAVDVNPGSNTVLDRIKQLKTSIDTFSSNQSTSNTTTQTLITAIRDYIDNVETNLAQIVTNTADLDINTDGIEVLLTQIRDYVDTLEAKLQTIIVNTDGASGYLVEIRDNLDTVETKLQTISNNTDGIEGLLTQIRDYVDATDSIVVELQTLNARGITIETKITQSIVELQLIKGSLDVTLSTRASETTLQEVKDRLPPTLNNDGGLKVHVQNPSTLQDVNLTKVGGITTSLGQKPSASSIPVVIASDQNINVTASNMAAYNVITETNYDLSASSYSGTSSVLVDSILNKIDFVFSTTESRTITITRSNGSILYQDTNTVLNLNIEEIDEAFDGDDNFTIEISQTTSPCFVSIKATSLVGTISLGADPMSIVGQGTSPWVVSGTVTANAGTNLNTSLLARESGGNLASIKSKTDNLDVLLSTRLKPADTLAAITSITNVVHVDDNSGSLTIDNPTLSVVGAGAEATALRVTLSNESLSALESITVNGSVTANAGTNLNTSLLALESGGNLAIIAGKDFATQTTLALIKAKTDNLDVLLSTRLKPADTLTAVTTIGTITNVVHVDDNAGSLTVDGSVSATQSGTWTNTVTQATGTNLHVVVDSGAITITPSGTQNTNITQIGGVTVLSGSGATGTGSERVTVAVDSATVAGSATLPTGSNTIGSIASITTSIVPGTGATNLGKAEDAGHTTGDVGLMDLGVRNENQATQTSAEQDYSAKSVDRFGNIIVVNKTASVALGDSVSNTALLISNQSGVGANMGVYGYYYNGSTWDRLRGNTSGSLVHGSTASGTTKVGNPVQIGGVFNTTQPTVTTGQVVESQATARGGLIVATGVDTFTVTANAGTGTFTTKETTSSTPAQSSPSITTSSTSVLASNANRLGATIYNEGTADAYVKLGATASTTSYTIKMALNSYYEVPFNYTGVINAITSSGTAQLRVTEIT